MFNSKKFLDEYCGYEYDYHGTYYEVIGVKYGKVILQDLSSDYSTTIDLADWDDFHSKYVVKEDNLEPLSESLQAQLEADFEKEFGPFEDDKEPISWKQFQEESKAMDKFVLKWRMKHGV